MSLLHSQLPVIREITDLTEAKKYWDLLAEQQTVFDNWDFRYCFYKYFNYPLHFIVGFLDEQPIGLLPLQKNTDQGYLEFFGGSYMEDNRVMIVPGYEEHVPKFFSEIHETAKLEYMPGEHAFIEALPVEDYKFTLPLEGLHSHEDYTDRDLTGEFRKKIRAAYRKMTEMGVRVVRNNFTDIELLFSYNINAFGDHSSFVDRPHQKEIFRDFLKPPFTPILLTFILNEKPIAVSLALLNGTTYSKINTGTAPDAPSNTGTFISLTNINTAIAAGANLYDVFVGDYGWKERWQFRKTPTHIWEHV